MFRILSAFLYFWIQDFGLPKCWIQDNLYRTRDTRQLDHLVVTKFFFLAAVNTNVKLDQIVLGYTWRCWHAGIKLGSAKWLVDLK